MMCTSCHHTQHDIQFLVEAPGTPPDVIYSKCSEATASVPEILSFLIPPPPPNLRSVPGRVTSSTRRPPGTRDELMYQNTMKTSSAERRLRAAYAARIRGVLPAAYPFFSSGGGTTDEEFDPEMLEFLGYGSGVFDGEEGRGTGSDGVS